MAGPKFKRDTGTSGAIGEKGVSTSTQPQKLHFELINS